MTLGISFAASQRITHDSSHKDVRVKSEKSRLDAFQDIILQDILCFKTRK